FQKLDCKSMKRLFPLLIYFFLTVDSTNAQSLVKTYYDSAATLVKEEYYILKDDSSLVDGTYKMFHENGKKAVEGNFENGKKDGLFKEYYPDGILKREMTYQQGLREGEVKVYSPGGKLAQK